MEEQETTRIHGPTVPPIVRYIVSAVTLGTLATWLVNGLVCYHALWSWCGFDAYVTVAGLVALGVIAPLAHTDRERAMRRAARGMWARRSWGSRAGQQLTATFNRAVRFAIEGEWPQQPGLITGEQRFERRGWWVDVPLDGGRAVWVERYELWQWLIEIEGLVYHVGVGESPISERLWEPELGRARWMAYVSILESVGAAEAATGDPRSRRYLPGQPWGRVEEYE